VLHQRCPLVIGNKVEVERATELMKADPAFPPKG
jgi:fructose-1,6-bisphosphatase